MPAKLLLLLMILVPHATLRAMPEYVSRALEKLGNEIPPGWSYSMKTERDGVTMVERFESAAPHGPGTWTLLSHNGSEPDEARRRDYSEMKQRARRNESGAPAFDAGSVDRSSAEIIASDESGATVRLRFKESAADSDKMLAHLDLVVRIRRDSESVAGYEMKLKAPYSPVLGVKMNSLVAGAEYDERGLPLRTFSSFKGRIFLMPVEEKIEITYEDYAHTGPAGAN